jgi:hypothetical protein
MNKITHIHQDLFHPQTVFNKKEHDVSEVASVLR